MAKAEEQGATITLPPGVNPEQVNSLLLALLGNTVQGLVAPQVQATLEAQKRDKDADARYEKFKASFALSVQERNFRSLVDAYGEGPKWFLVHLPEAKEQPNLPIPASSKEEAQGRYLIHFGITSAPSHPVAQEISKAQVETMRRQWAEVKPMDINRKPVLMRGEV